MAERPLLIFPEPAKADRRTLPPPNFQKPHIPSPGRQSDRLEAKLSEVTKAFQKRQAELRSDPSGAEVEQVLVLETVGRIDDFFKAVRNLEGLEWMGELDLEGITPDDEFFWDDDPQKVMPGRLYLVMSNMRGLQQLLSLWNLFRSNPENPQFVRGQTKWRDLFKLLRDIRPWGPEDRLHETGLLDVWSERTAEGAEDLCVEVELWPRRNPSERQKAIGSISRVIAEASGEVLGQAYIPEIHYHGMLVRLPIHAVERLVRMEYTRLVQCDDVMFFRPSGQTIIPVPSDEMVFDNSKVPVPVSGGVPVVALLDGYPLENHELLAGRLVIDDPDNWAGECSTGDRKHGTAMASLILHGEIDGEEAPARRAIYVRPVMKPVAGFRQTYECIPESTLPVDLVHRAIRRMKEGEGTEPPAAPHVVIVNLSLGDLRHSYNGYPTPWARLLDYLAWKYRLLFMVSAGNYVEDLDLGVSRSEFDALRKNPPQLEKQVLSTLIRLARMRPLRSPADAINVLTIGALHSDRAPVGHLGLRMNPLQSLSLPSPINAQGPGFRKAVKPDILLAGGRQPYMEKMVTTPTATIQVSPATAPPGQKVAWPSSTPGVLNATTYTRGTSNATALGTRAAAKLFDLLNDLRSEPGGELLDAAHSTVLIKALMVHSATWGDAADFLEPLLGATTANWRKAALARLLGYGGINPERVLECTAQRATLLGAGELGDDEAHVYRLPLPPSLSGRRLWRRLTISLAWLTPVNPTHRAYRKAALWFDPYDNTGSAQDLARLLGTDRQDAQWQTVRNGTLQHEVFEGERATAFVDGDQLVIQVNCRQEAGELETRVPYGLVVTLEVAEGVDVAIYNEIRTRIRPAVRVTPEP